MTQRNLYSPLPTPLDVEHFETLLQRESFQLERIVSRGHSSPPEGWYEEPRDEWVMLLRGAAELEFESEGKTRLRPGDCLLIPARQRHRVNWTDPQQETVWLALHCDPTDEAPEQQS
jgi:cupin 2 domain-containing protein